MGVITRGARIPKRPRNPGLVDIVSQFPIPDATIVSLLHLNGPNASTNIIDERGKTWLVSGNAQIKTDQFVFGGSSANVANAGQSGNYISTPNHSDFNFAANNWAFDCRLRLASITDNLNLFNRRGGPGNESFTLSYQQTSNLVRFNYTTDGSTFVGPVTWSWTPSLNTWYHFEFGRSGSNLYCFINGVQIGSPQSISGSIFNGNATVKLLNDGSNATTVNAHIDEVRICNVIKHTSNFTPPEQEYY